MDMSGRGPYRIPPTSALIAFESAARHGNFSRAARELRTSQSAISRHIASLERQLSTRLFHRSRTGVSLTDAGSRYRDAVAIGLGAIHAGAAEVAELSSVEQVELVIACSDEISHLFVMPRYDALQKALGDQVRIRILTYQHNIRYLPPTPVADVILSWDPATNNPEDCAVILQEKVSPLCSPGYAALHAETLRQPVTDWSKLTFLDIARPNEGWASWDNWFDVVGHPGSEPRYANYDNYTYVLEAAAAGQGIALGWRHFIERYLESGALITLDDKFLETDNRFCAVVTKKGRQRPLARKCLNFFEKCI
ncbi:MAG: LysR family transcriptional regulator [Rhodospirillales bacterium]|nr:LysR family transcriptional regulator [Rhodospirillales bacterium]